MARRGKDNVDTKSGQLLSTGTITDPKCDDDDDVFILGNSTLVKRRAGSTEFLIKLNIRDTLNN